MYQFRLERVVFKDGTQLNPSGLTVILGPNNVGKSASLNEIADCISLRPNLPLTLLQDIDWALPNDLDELLTAYPIERHQNEAGNWVWRTLSADLSRQHLQSTSAPGATDWRPGLGNLFTRKGQQAKEQFTTHFGHEFVAWLKTEHRLQMVRRGGSGKEDYSAESLLQLLYTHPKSKEIESRIRSLVSGAFGLEIALDFTSLQNFELRIGDNFSALPEDPREARTILSQCPSLDDQGDGIRSFVGIVAALEVLARPLILIDEPEAFLHPPHAFQIGAFLARSVASNRQILVATHSADFLRGVLSVTTDVTIARLDRSGAANSVKVLDPGQLRSIANDALLSSARVVDGLFYRSAVVVEADRDARFYQAGARKFEKGQDLHFVNADNKQTVPRIMSLYKQMGVPCAGIVDFDVLNDSSEFKKQLDALELPEVESGEAQSARDEIDQDIQKLDPKKRLENVKERFGVVQKIVDRASESDPNLGTVLKQIERECNRVATETKPWREAKQLGRSALTNNVALKFDRLYEICKAKGLLINPAGELESMLVDYNIDYSTDKSAWFQTAIGVIGGLNVDLTRQPWKFLNNVIESLG